MNPTIDVRDLATRARHASAQLKLSSGDQRDAFLAALAALLRRHAPEILAANVTDRVEAGQSGLSAAMLDRLLLDPARIDAMADLRNVHILLCNPHPQNQYPTIIAGSEPVH